MPYATPALFVQRFGLTETAQLLADEQQLVTPELLQSAINVAGGGAWTGTPSADEMAAANAALARLLRVLATTSNFMDGYLRSAVTLPLAAGDANAGVLEECCLGLARFAVADDSDNATERMDKAAETWRAWLKDVAAGRTQLVSPAGVGAASSVSGKTHSGQAESGFCWGGFGSGFGGVR